MTANVDHLYNENCFGPPSLDISTPAFVKAAQQSEAFHPGNFSENDCPISNWQEWLNLPDEERAAIEDECW